MVQSLTMRLAWIIFGTIETLTIAALQTDVISPDLLSIFVQLPLIGLFAWYVLKKDRDTREWIEHLMEEKDKQHTREIEARDKQHARTVDLFEKIIDRQDNRQSESTKQIGDLGQQLVINTATVNESMRQSELVEELKRLVNDKHIK